MSAKAVDSAGQPGNSTQDSIDGEIDAFLRAEMARARIPGALVAVVDEDRPTKLGCYGLADVELGVRVDVDSLFQIGSIGKQFTAVAILQLVYAGQLRLTDLISRHVPESPSHWRDVTIQQLLSHTSGIPGYNEGPRAVDYRRSYSDRELFEVIASASLKFPPGASWSYSNSGFLLLGNVIERITGTPFDAILETAIWRPAGMDGVKTMRDRELIPHRATGYSLENGDLTNSGWIDPCFSRHADGGQYWGIRDAAQWARALGNESIVSQQVRDRMWNSVTCGPHFAVPLQLRGAGYGCAWYLDDENGERVCYHAGAWAGFVSYIAHFPDAGKTVIFCANQEDAPIVAIGRGIARRVLQRVDVPQMADSPAAPTAKLKAALMAIATGQSAAHDPLASNIAIRRRAARLGRPAGVELLEARSMADVHRFRYRIRYDCTTLRLEVMTGRDGRLQGPVRVETE